MRTGDPVLFYHTGSERAVVGVAKVSSAPRRDPSDERGAFMVTLAPVRALTRPVPLSEVRADARLCDLALVRISRLSVMPVTPGQWAAIESLARRQGP